MIVQTTIGSEDCLLILERPDWGGGIELSLTRRASIIRGQTRRENRSIERNTLELKQRFTLVLQEDALEDLRNELAVLGDTRVAVPVWPDYAFYADYADRYLSATQWITFNEAHDAYAVNTGTYTYYAPLMFGRLTQASIASIDENTGEFVVEIEEDIPYSHRLLPNTVSSPSDWPTELFPNRVSDPVEIASDGLEWRDYTKHGRNSEAQNPEVPFRWEQEADFTVTTRADIQVLINFWYNHGGRVGAFSIPAFLQPGSATDEAPHGFQARLASDTLTLQFDTQTLCETHLKFIQLPWELLGAPAGETPVQAPQYWLMKLEFDAPGKADEYFTTWEDTITYDSNDYVPLNFKVDRLDMDLKLTRLSAGIVYHKGDQDPILPFVLGGMERMVKATFYAGNPNTPSSFNSRFKGTLQPVRAVGRSIRATFQAFDGALDREFPWFSYSRSCNYILGDDNCGIDLESVKNVGTGATADLSESDRALYVRSLSGSLSAGVLDPDSNQWDRFAGGFLEVGTGDDYQIRFIVKSDYEGGTNRKVYLSKPLDSTKLANAGSPATVTLYPGCGNTKWECEDAHSNYAKFGGMPYMPDQLNQLQGSGPPGGK